MRGDTSRPELFLIYGIIVSVLVLVIFFTKINQLFNFQNIIEDYYANELALTANAVSARSGYTSIGYEVNGLNAPTVSIDGENITLTSKGSPGSGTTVNGAFVRSRYLTAPAVTQSATSATSFVFVYDGKLSVSPGAACPSVASQAPASDAAFVGIAPKSASSILIATSDPALGCDLFDTYSSDYPKTLVQRVIVPASALASYANGKKVVVFAR